MRLGAVDPDGDLGAGGAKFLKESAVGPDPQVLLCDLHLEESGNDKPIDAHHTLVYPDFTKMACLDVGAFRTYNTQVPGARRGVQTKEKPCNSDHVVLNK